MDGVGGLISCGRLPDTIGSTQPLGQGHRLRLCTGAAKVNHLCGERLQYGPKGDSFAIAVEDLTALIFERAIGAGGRGGKSSA